MIRISVFCSGKSVGFFYLNDKKHVIPLLRCFSIMSTLIVYAHPKTEGFCSFFVKVVVEYLKNQDIDFKILDLYESGFDPVLKADEHYTSGNRLVSDEVKEIQQKISEASHLIFIYPVWWASMPAVLKGFLDRVFVPHFAFSYSRKGALKWLPVGLLKEKKALVLMSLGSPHVLYTLLGNPPKRMIKTLGLGFFGMKICVRQVFDARNLSEKRMRSVSKMVVSSLRWLYS